MAEQSTASADRSGPAELRERQPRGGNPLARWLRAIGLFLQQVLDELSKVVRPTRDQLVSYTIAVLVFVVVMMMYIFGLDQLFEWVVGKVFSGGLI